VAAVGIACQRNTEFAWDVTTHRPVGHAISWQDLRSLPMVEEVAAWEHGHEARHRLGYAPGPYSSALHIAWRMRHEPEFAAAARAGRLHLGLSAEWLLQALGEAAADGALAGPHQADENDRSRNAQHRRLRRRRVDV